MFHAEMREKKTGKQLRMGEKFVLILRLILNDGKRKCSFFHTRQKTLPTFGEPRRNRKKHTSCVIANKFFRLFHA